MITLDIETEAIEDGAPLLPKPVGCAIIFNDVPAHTGWYYGWGHPDSNPSVRESFAEALRAWIAMGETFVTHNGLSFDIPILEHYFDVKFGEVHDTLFLAYLHNPHTKSLSLKDLANDWLGMPPDEQRDLHEWIMVNTVCRSKSSAGGYISEAPEKLVAPYAIGDVLRTKRLFEFVFPAVSESMLSAYQREVQLAPIVADMQIRGVRTDYTRLREDLVKCQAELAKMEKWLRKELGDPLMNLDSNPELISALKAKGFTNFLTTEKGAPSVSSDSLDQALVSAPKLRTKLHERATMATLVNTFLLPWTLAASKNEGRIHASYNQVRNPDGFGTRTGRLSSSKPNFQNVPGDLGEGFPLMRSYLLPEEGHVWVTGDFKNQEPRIAAHFEDGALMQAFKDNPQLDPYLFVAELAGGIERKHAKVVLLGILYGMGAKLLATQLGITFAEATALRDAVKRALPDIMTLDEEGKYRFRLGLPIKTLGGRLYNCEPPSRGKTYEYKALNVLIQGSAADQTKEALIYINDRLAPGERILGTVHDEISISCPIKRVPAIIKLMGEAANALKCDVPMLMDIKYGNNWAEAK